MQEARTVLLLPEPLAGGLEEVASQWVAAWVLDPFLTVRLGSGAVAEDGGISDVRATIVGRDRTVGIDLLDELSERSSALLRVVAVSVSDELLGVDGAAMRAEARRVLRTLQRARSEANTVRPLNLVVAETRTAGLAVAEVGVGEWRASVLAVPENRTSLTSFDAFVRASRVGDFHGFVLAHAATVGGLWSGMGTAPFDTTSHAGSSVPVVELQRIAVRGVLSQDFTVRMAEEGLRPLLAEETPLRDPSVRAEFGDDAPKVLPDQRVDEALDLLLRHVMPSTGGTPLRYRPYPSEPEPTRDRVGPWAAIRGFAAFAADKVAVLPRWTAWWFRTRVATAVGRRLHGPEGMPVSGPSEAGLPEGPPGAEDPGSLPAGTTLVTWGRDPFGDPGELERDLERAAELRAKGLDALARPLPVTLEGPDTYADVWARLRRGAFLLLDADRDPASASLMKDLTDASLDGVLPRRSGLFPDPREPWSPHPEVVDLVAAEIGGAVAELPRTVAWLDLDPARAWSTVLGELERTYTERVRSVERAVAATAESRATVDAAVARCDRDLTAARSLLALDEHDLGSVLDARIAAALAGVPADVRVRLVPERLLVDSALDEPPGDGPDEDVAPGEGEEPVTAQPAFDRQAAMAWEVELERERTDLDERRSRLDLEVQELTAQREQLETVHPMLVRDALGIRAWLWRLEASFAGRMVTALDAEAAAVERDLEAVRARLESGPPFVASSADLYRRFVARFLLGGLLGVVASALLWDPVTAWLDDFLGQPIGDAVATVLGVPVWIVAAVLVLVLLGSLLGYHRSWSRRHRALTLLRHHLRELIATVTHLQAERLRISELHRQARGVMRLLAEVIHRPFLLDGVTDELPSSSALDRDTLPKVLRLARPEISDTWDGERRFVQRILLKQLRRGWREEAYAQLLEAVQARFGLVRGDVDADLLDRDPTARAALLEHLLADEAQRSAGVARLRSVVQDISGWRVESDFPYPPVRVMRPSMDMVDVRTDMFDTGEDIPEGWRDFLAANIDGDRSWSDLNFAAGKRRMAEDLVRQLHAPERFRSDDPDVQHRGLRSDEVRPVEFVICVDLHRAPVVAEYVQAFAPLRSLDDDREDDLGETRPEEEGESEADEAAAGPTLRY